MLKQMSSRTTIAVLLVAAVMMAAAGTAIASNMAFKLNKGIEPPVSGTQKGNNFTSIPYFKPYTTFSDFCAQTGLPNSGALGSRTVVQEFNATTGGFDSGVCGVSTLPLTPGYGLQIRKATAAGPTSIIIVGSHNPGLSINIPQAVSGTKKGDYWLSVPYHSTAVTLQDMCNQIPLVSAGALGGRGTVVRLDALAGGFVTCLCGSSPDCTSSLKLGEAAKLRQVGLSAAGLTFIPAHF